VELRVVCPVCGLLQQQKKKKKANVRKYIHDLFYYYC
jgi:uncharacterized Zn finger protein (UPF0148 family)